MSIIDKDALWARYFTVAPRRRPRECRPAAANYNFSLLLRWFEALLRALIATLLRAALMVGENTAMIRPAPTHAEFASRVSTHREAVTRELNQLSRDGLVERQAGALAIHDVERLARLVQNVVGH